MIEPLILSIINQEKTIVVKFTRWLVHGVNHLHGFDATCMTILVLTYFVDGFQPEGPLK